MISVILAIVVGLSGFATAHCAVGAGIGWSVFWAIIGFAAFQAIFGYLIRKRITRDMEKVQSILMAGQKQIQAKTQRWQMRPPSSIQEAQREIFADTKVFVREALKQTEELAKYRLWVPMIRRQMATAQLQLSWMIKDFKTVDKLFPKAILLDPTLVAMKMARMYMLNEETDAIGKVYRKAVRRLRYNQNVLLAATWSWILIQRNDSDGAFKALTEALRKSDNETLKRNHEVLMNNRVAHFNNSGLGDVWYSLLLEEPKVKMQRPHGFYR